MANTRIHRRKAAPLLHIVLILGIWGGTQSVRRTSAAAPPPRASSLAAKTAELDAFLAGDAMFQAIKQVDRPQFNRFRSLMIEALRSGKTQGEIDRVSGQFGNEFLQTRLRRASPATIKRYLALRADFMTQVAAISPAFLYVTIAAGDVNTVGITAKTRQEIGRVNERLTNQLADIIRAPLAVTPTPLDTVSARKNLVAARSRLNAGERAELAKAGRADVDPALFCRAYIHLYRECLRLPDVQAAQVFRLMGAIPADDRAKR